MDFTGPAVSSALTIKMLYPTVEQRINTLCNFLTKHSGLSGKPFDFFFPEKVHNSALWDNGF